MTDTNREDEFIKKQRAIDEAMTTIIDRMPRLWRQLYLRCIEEGFDRVKLSSS